MVDFDKADNVLDQIDLVLSRLIGASDYSRDKIKRASTERWRWDEPAITLTWSQFDDISRNLRTVIVEHGASPTLEVEVNAWQDQDQEGKRVRHWKYEKVGHVRILFDPQKPWRIDPEELFKTVEFGFKTASSWTKDRLTRVHVPSSPSM